MPSFHVGSVQRYTIQSSPPGTYSTCIVAPDFLTAKFRDKYIRKVCFMLFDNKYGIFNWFWRNLVENMLCENVQTEQKCQMPL